MQEAIAILDSGVGGLTVAKEVMRQLPQEKVIYFGDTSRAPYGPRSPEEVKMFTQQIVRYLQQFEPKMFVIACNTATAVALEDIRAKVSVPVVGVIHPGCRAAIKKTKSNVIGVIGTEGTIHSQAYELALKQISPNIQVISQACPALVPLVEKGMYDAAESKAIVRDSLAPLKDQTMDCLILGCTHYPFLSKMIGEVIGSQVELINSAEETAREISTVLYHRGQLAVTEEAPKHQFYCSGNPALFQQIAQQWLDQAVDVTPMEWQIPRIG